MMCNLDIYTKLLVQFTHIPLSAFCARFGLVLHPDDLIRWQALIQKYHTMNPGASWTSSTGMVRSRIATSPNTSSAMGTTGWAERWAMKWKPRRAALLCTWWKFERRLVCGQLGEMCDGSPRCHSPPGVHASPAACLPVLHFTWHGKVGLQFVFSLPPPSPPPPRPLNGSSSKDTSAMEAKMFFYEPETVRGETCCSLTPG